MSYVICALLSAMVGGVVGMFTMAAVIVGHKSDKMVGDYYDKQNW